MPRPDGSIFGIETLDNSVVNVTAVTELALAVLIARGGELTSLLGTHSLTGSQWLIGAAPAVLLLALWEFGKLIARHDTESQRKATSDVAVPAEPKQAGPAAA